MPKLLTLHPDSAGSAHPTLKAEIRVLFEKTNRPMTEFEVWTHFAHREHAPRPALVNAALFTLVDEGVLVMSRPPGQETFFGKGAAVYSLPSSAKGVAK